MTSSLVGSEMCIRDRGKCHLHGAALRRHTQMRNTLAISCMEAGAYVDLERSYPLLGPSLADTTGTVM
eukprot:12536178-Prorocentrum_lima.AAC.1